MTRYAGIFGEHEVAGWITADHHLGTFEARWAHRSRRAHLKRN
jgi:hypothetical protein